MIALAAVMDGIPITALPPSMLLGACIMLVLTGRLIPRSTYDDKVHEASEWRAESRIKDAQIAEKDRQLAHLEEVGLSVNAVMRAVQSKASGSEAPG